MSRYSRPPRDKAEQYRRVAAALINLAREEQAEQEQERQAS